MGESSGEAYRGLSGQSSTHARRNPERVSLFHLNDAQLSVAKDPQRTIHSISRIWSYPRMSAPTLRPDGYYYFSFNSGLQSQSPIYRVAKDNIGQADQHRELFFDPNLLSQDGTVSVGSSSFSKSARYWGYTVSRSELLVGARRSSLHESGTDRGTLGTHAQADRTGR